MAAVLIGSDDYALPVRAVVKKEVRTGSTSAAGMTVKKKVAKQTPKLNLQPNKAFSERLCSLGDKKSITLPIILDANEEEVEDYMTENRESVTFRWHYHSDSGKFYIDELGGFIHESIIGEISGQLGIEAKKYGNIVASLADTCSAPSSYGKEIEPDACIRARKKVPKANRKNAADSKGRYYPSVVVEVGFSQSTENLMRKIDAWFDAGDDSTGVRCAVEIDIDYQDPPTFARYRLVRRNQRRRRPRYKIMELDKFGDPGEADKHQLKIPAEDFFYPLAPPDDVDSIVIGVGAAYKTALSLTQLESDEEEEVDKEDEDGEEADDGEPAQKRSRN